MALVEMNENELKAQIAINDVALKAAGLPIAESVVVLTKKYQEALNPAPPFEPDSPKTED